MGDDDDLPNKRGD
jgi:Ca2+-binding EF-hand superfamily protein